MSSHLHIPMLLMNWLSWVRPLGLLAIALLVGFWLQRFALPRLLSWASHARWQTNDIVLRAIRGPVILWALMAGLYLAVKFSQAPLGVVNTVGLVLKALWIFSVAWVSAKTIARLITHYASQWQLGLPMTSLTQHLARLVVLALGLLIMLDSLGVNITTLLAALGVGSLAVALGLQDTLANLFAGIYITLSKHVRLGDFIQLENGEEGYVTDIGWRATKIRMLSNNTVIVPNARLSQSIITNYYLPEKALVVTAELGVDYASDLDQVERVTCDVARDIMQTVPGGVPSFEPMVRFHTFGDSSIRFTVIMQAREVVDQYHLKHELIKRLHQRYQQEGIVIPFPIQVVYTKPGDASAGSL